MVPVKTMKEYELLQDLTVLFCETVDRYVAFLQMFVFGIKFTDVHCSTEYLAGEVTGFKFGW